MKQPEIIFCVRRSPEGGYEARALGHSIFTQADTMDELKLNASDAVHCHFDEGQPRLAIRFVAAERTLGSAKGELTVPDDFNDPLPDDILAAFEGR